MLLFFLNARLKTLAKLLLKVSLGSFYSGLVSDR